MLHDFSKKVRQTLERHDVQDEKLELVLTSLFKEFENHILSKDFIEEIISKQEQASRLNRRGMGRL